MIWLLLGLFIGVLVFVTCVMAWVTMAEMRRHLTVDVHDLVPSKARRVRRGQTDQTDGDPLDVLSRGV